MKNAGISEFILNKEFIFKFDNGGMCAADLTRKIDSPSKIMKSIKQALKNRLHQKYAITALQDIENQLVERHDEIFSHNKSDYTNNTLEDQQKSNYLKRVTELKKEREETNFNYELWQTSVQERYKKVREVTERNFPDAWPLLQFCLAVKSILNIDGCTLPFMGVILAIPSSMKTLVIQLFRKYPHSLSSDNFTPNSFESHNASLTEEELRKVDLLPKLFNKLFLTPELAPIFTANDDELRKTLGIITRLLDGHGLETDSGAQGHRKYGNTFFVWIGAAVEIPYRVWLLLGTLGHKIYMFRPIIREKSIQELQNIAKENDFQERFKEIEDALIEYLIDFDAAPNNGNVRTDEKGITKVKWNEEKNDEQDKAIICIARVANLLKRLRGTVYVSKYKTNTSGYNSKSPSVINNDNPSDKSDQENRDTSFLSVSGSDYDTDYPVIEDPSRAVIILRNLALANAISQGRNLIILEDIQLIINAALSSTTRARSELIKLLIKHDGELTTSTIVRESRISPAFAKKTMTELAALEIVDISSIAGYSNSEFKITLTKEYSWFKSQEFKEFLNRDGILLNGSSKSSTNIKQKDSSDAYQSQTSKLDDDNNENYTRARQSMAHLCDNEAPQSHVEIKSTTERHEKILEDYNNPDECNISDVNKFNNKNDFDNNYNQIVETESYSNKESSNVDDCDNSTGVEEKNNVPLWGSKSFQLVTSSQAITKIIEGDLTRNKILEEIKKVNGSVVSVGNVLELIHKQYEFVRIHIGNKLSQRENRKVRQLYLDIIRNNNIEVVKHRPNLLVRWNPSKEYSSNSGSSK
jgi:hypothetical protein